MQEPTRIASSNEFCSYIKMSFDLEESALRRVVSRTEQSEPLSPIALYNMSKRHIIAMALRYSDMCNWLKTQVISLADDTDIPSSKANFLREYGNK